MKYLMSIFIVCMFFFMACTSEPTKKEQQNAVVEQLAEQQINDRVQQIREVSKVIVSDSLQSKTHKATTVSSDSIVQAVQVKNVVEKKNVAEKKEILKQQFSNSVFLKNVACCKQIEEEECCCKGIQSTYAEKITNFLDGQLKAQVLADYKNDPLYNKCHQKYNWFSTAIKLAEQKIEEADEDDDW